MLAEMLHHLVVRAVDRSVIHDNDDDRRVSFLCFRLRGSRYSFGDFEGKNFLFRQLGANNGR